MEKQELSLEELLIFIEKVENVNYDSNYESYCVKYKEMKISVRMTRSGPNEMHILTATIDNDQVAFYSCWKYTYKKELYGEKKVLDIYNLFESKYHNKNNNAPIKSPIEKAKELIEELKRK